MKFYIIISSILAIVKGCFVTIPSGHIGVYSWLYEIQNETMKTAIFYNCIMGKIDVVRYIPDSDFRENILVPSSEGIEEKVLRVEISNSIDPKYIIQVVKEYDQKLVVEPMA